MPNQERNQVALKGLDSTSYLLLQKAFDVIHLDKPCAIHDLVPFPYGM